MPSCLLFMNDSGMTVAFFFLLPTPRGERRKFIFVAGLVLFWMIGLEDSLKYHTYFLPDVLRFVWNGVGHRLLF